MAERGLLDFMIIHIPGLKPAEQGMLCKKFDREEDLAGLSKLDLEMLLGRPLKQFSPADELRFAAEKDLKAAHRQGIAWVSWASVEYPPLLREIYDPPVLIFYRGSLPTGEKPLAAIVGTRKPQGPALQAAFDIARGLGKQGISVISGLALGIDAMAHRGNLEGGARTYAVLGSGVDEIYPATNRPVARRILEGGGGIISEYPPGTGPQKWRFPARNRIISAFARGTLIVEAPATSGALITARFALEQGRDLWVSSAGLQSEGIARLVDEGAKIIYSASDILGEWGVELKNEAGNEERENNVGKALASSLARQLTIGS